MTKITLIHYGELSLKGRNRDLFEIRLKNNIESAAGGRVKRFRGRFVLHDGNPEGLKDVFGISWYAEAFKIDKNIDCLSKAILSMISSRVRSDLSFGVFVKRSDKGFPFTSMEVADIIGRDIVSKYNLKVNLKNPDIPVYIEIADELYVYFNKNQGLKGLPVGVSGKVLSLFSGGIDSPVASYLIMKRGCEIHYIHFHVFSSADYLKDTKILKLLSCLKRYQRDSKLFLVPYYPFETQMLKDINTYGHELVLFRRFMVKVAERIALQNDYKALITGDSLGQVASQTIENIALVNSATSLPLIQPLISYDKQEIVDLSKQIGTYEDSILPYKDCCSIVTSNPRTKANRKRILELEQKFEIDALVDKALDLVSIYEP